MSIDETGLCRLMAWLSPSFPVGAFSYSHGLEWAVEDGLVKDGAALARWVEGVVALGAGRSDAALLLAAHRAVLASDREGLDWAAERGAVLRPTAELGLESSAQGQAFLNTVRAAWPHPFLEDWAKRLKEMGHPPAYPVAVGVASALAGITERAALAAFLHAFAANLVSAAVRLVPLGQTDGQRAMAALEAPVLAAMEAALRRPLDDLGSSAPMVDWTSCRHETQYTRLFRS
ncbi:urease accessory protein UreF [Telmatospirillum sp. J64-1]|uniref:urease accessory protein UreF n=1 Tax=Telmatospirillum sp. J64-1 TaxID=2502183 RepID=UPI0021022D84|nr:urease accessory protein UreF [Telmatospirillum sp. J64-1]